MVLHPISHFSIVMEKGSVQRKRPREKSSYAHNALPKAFRSSPSPPSPSPSSSTRKGRVSDGNNVVSRCCVRERSVSNCKHGDPVVDGPESSSSFGDSTGFGVFEFPWLKEGGGVVSKTEEEELYSEGSFSFCLNKMSASGGAESFRTEEWWRDTVVTSGFSFESLDSCHLDNEFEETASAWSSILEMDKDAGGKSDLQPAA